MITIKTMFEKSALNKAKTESLLLVELTGTRKEIKTKRQVLNLSIAIDISGSMQELINKQKDPVYDTRTMNIGHIPQIGFPSSLLRSQQIYTGVSKLDQAKKAAIKAIEKMGDSDMVSVVAFDNRADVIVPACHTTASNKVGIIQAINRLSPRGGTDLHTGWLAAATEVAKNVKEKSLNRVLLLSDGETNSGVQSVEQISNDVMAIYNTSISTTTFGIGDSFNEDLLQAMSNSGGGNSYYIKDDKNFDQMFAEEFAGMSNVCGSEVKLSFDFKEGFKVKEQLNSLITSNEVYLLPNIVSNTNFVIMFKIETLIEKGLKLADIGKIKIDYKDEEGNLTTFTTELSSKVVGKKAWDELEYNAEVKVQETLMIVANNKLEATRYLSRGDLAGAQGILRGSAEYVSTMGASYSDSRLFAENNSLESTIQASASGMSVKDLRKDIAYQSLNTRTGKDTK